MNLTLVAFALNDQPLSQPITAVFDGRGGTIGRADHNTMALPDPQRHISRLQAEIVAHGAAYIIRNVGASNPIVVNGRSLAHGDTAALAQNEQVRMGGYLLKAHLSSASPVDAKVHAHRPQSWTEAVPAAKGAAPVNTPTDPFAALFDAAPVRAAASQESPFADLLDSSPTSTRMLANPVGELARSAKNQDPFAGLMPPPAGVPADSAAVAAKPATVSLLPDDFDPFAEPQAQSKWPGKPVSAAQTPPVTDVFEALAPRAQQPTLDSVFGLGPMGADDPLARFLEHKSPAPGPNAAAALNAVSADPMALFASTSHAAAPAPSPAMQMAQPDNVAALHAAFKPPTVEGSVSRTVPLPAVAKPLPSVASIPVPIPAPTPAPASPAPSLSAPILDAAEATPAAALWAAFCDGAGLTNVQLSGTPEQQMHELGRILRSATEGTLQLMAVRSSTKHELRAGVTIIQQRNNNPLKFSPDAMAALTQMLQPPMRGFLNGPAAMDDAMHDLVGHSIGTVAGLRAAVEGMLERFAPQELERKLSRHSVFDSVLPSARKARLWDLYLQHHQGIREEAQEDFHTLFGKAFLAAYEQQIERLRSKAAQR